MHRAKPRPPERTDKIYLRYKRLKSELLELRLERERLTLKIRQRTKDVKTYEALIRIGVTE